MVTLKQQAFSEFFRNASPQEKEKIYQEVIEKACERQKEMLEESQVSYKETT